MLNRNCLSRCSSELSSCCLLYSYKHGNGYSLCEFWSVSAALKDFSWFRLTTAVILLITTLFGQAKAEHGPHTFTAIEGSSVRVLTNWPGYELPGFRASPGTAPEGTGFAFAAGNSLGLGISFSCGVVSAKVSKNTGFNPVEDFIQTDAADNPGASGGLLVNAVGQGLGLIDVIFTKSEDSDAGVNFAVSAKLIKRSLLEWADQGDVFTH